MEEIEAEISERFRCRKDVHLERAAKELMPKLAWGAMKEVRFGFRRPRRRAVRDLEALWTSSPMSRWWTRMARVERRMWAFLEGQTG